MFGSEYDRPEYRETRSDWRETGQQDAENGKELVSFFELQKDVLEYDGEELTYKEYAEYVLGYADFHDE